MQKSTDKIVFLSNYINHHQIPFCNAMNELSNGNFIFIQAEPMAEERVQMGWKQDAKLPYLKLYYEEPEECRQLVLDAKVVIFGGIDDESYIKERLKSGKPVIRYSERLYRTGQWRAVSPRGLWKKFRDHTKYRNKSVYLLCAGAYVPSDFHIVRAYPGKMFAWGYFPETKHYDVEKLMSEKGYGEQQIPYLLWVARMIDVKHPELPIEAAAYLRDRGNVFHMDIVGGGEKEAWMREKIAQLHLEEYVTMVGFLSPQEVRTRMEKANIFLFTSDRGEGWGAVMNESMNSGCTVVADHMVGSVPYLVHNGENGFIYRDGCKDMLFALTEKLVQDPALCRQMGKNAYSTIAKVWNPEYAATKLMHLIDTMICQDGPSQAVWMGKTNLSHLYPGAPAPVISEKKMWKLLEAQAEGKKQED